MKYYLPGIRGLQKITLTLALLMTGVCYGQTQHGWPLKISLFNEATTVPYSQLLTTPIHPGAQLGTEFDWKESKHLRLYPMVNIGYMFHRKLFQGLYVNAELGLDFTFDFGLNIKTALGAGYLHTFTTGQEYRFTDGGYQPKKDRGNSRIMPSFSLGLGYEINRDTQPVEFFVMYQSWIEYPYSPDFIPLMSHVNLHFGTKFYLPSNQSKHED